MGQLVLVFKADLLESIGHFSGCTRDVGKYLPTLLDPSHNHFMNRDLAEQDPRYKQLIPYVVLRHGNSLFSYVRGKRSSESRLVALRSVGVGGHIEPGDGSLFSSDETRYLQAARREVSEEIDLDTPYVERIIGLLNDESTDVGRVHFGIVHLWDLEAPKVKKREGLITQAGFMPIPELRGKAGDLEIWSRLVLGLLDDPPAPSNPEEDLRRRADVP